MIFHSFSITDTNIMKNVGIQTKHPKVFDTKKRKFAPIRESYDYFKTEPILARIVLLYLN